MALTVADVRAAQARAVQAARLGYDHRGAVHYTQGPQRWQGISEGLRASAGRYPAYADCSSYVTWCLWCALEPLGVDDVVNGQGWRAGYTGTMLAQGRAVAQPEEMVPGDAVIYGRPGSTGAHTAIVVTPGSAALVVSHGSESGPHLVTWRYRSDVMTIRRYIVVGGAGGTADTPPGSAAPPTPDLHPAVPAFPGRILRLQAPNMSGVDVSTWQARMVERGWHLVVDGVYGPASAQACRQFQVEKGLEVDGQVGPITWGAAWTATITP